MSTLNGVMLYLLAGWLFGLAIYPWLREKGDVEFLIIIVFGWPIVLVFAVFIGVALVPMWIWEEHEEDLRYLWSLIMELFSTWGRLISQGMERGLGGVDHRHTTDAPVDPVDSEVAHFQAIRDSADELDTSTEDVYPKIIDPTFTDGGDDDDS